MKTYPLAPDGIFWTLQGEGALVGEPMAFVRLAGCSVGCQQCDTNYRVARRVLLEQLVAEVQAVIPPNFTKPWVWITGGEPTDHDLEPLIDIFATVGMNVAIATSGIRVVSRTVQWISVSPHTNSIVQRNGHELKIVPGLNGLTLEAASDLGLGFAWKYIQPLAGDANSLKQSIAFVLRTPGWRLSSQQHKQWGLP